MKCFCLAFCLLLAACGGKAELPNTPQGLCHAAADSQWLMADVRTVLDGDTLVLDTGTSTEHIRLQGVDAPELAQSYGPQAQQTLSQLVLHQSVRVAYTQRDRYGRILGQVFTSSCADLNLQLLREGMAWFYKAYACDLDSARRLLYAEAESQARAQHLGLWQQSQPLAPWIYRNGEDPVMPTCLN
jgi:micrococcal nuclease